jgi:hypothetical protein
VSALVAGSFLLQAAVATSRARLRILSEGFMAGSKGVAELRPKHRPPA